MRSTLNESDLFCRWLYSQNSLIVTACLFLMPVRWNEVRSYSWDPFTTCDCTGLSQLFYAGFRYGGIALCFYDSTAVTSAVRHNTICLLYVAIVEFAKNAKFFKQNTTVPSIRRINKWARNVVHAKDGLMLKDESIEQIQSASWCVTCSNAHTNPSLVRSVSTWCMI